ncbi:tetratricopeptide repeat protein [Flagellatimonas centrodinii]|uniref:tetratricopeptide repeat protein n=1 Tax=Flagellatimonas centrodinii TaxID=2806210 RepID=UPI001FEDB7BA|nr:tetratricopeptide repeat protein [Flagellatimonas centrodinii]ULQ45712.1 tetratricopeptide repeat protein [Flagellatimonas centrodinii]
MSLAPRHLLLLTLPLALASACATVTPSERTTTETLRQQAEQRQDSVTQPLPSPTPPPRPQAINRSTEAQYHVLVGELALRRDQPEVAARSFIAALRSMPDVELATRATQLALATNDEDLALEAAGHWLRLEPTAMEPREVILRVSLINGDGEQALRQARAIVQGHAGGIDDGFRYLGLLLARVPPAGSDRALSLIDLLLRDYPQQPGAHYAMAMLALQFERLSLAETAARQARELAPEAREYALLLAGVWVRQGRIDEAVELVEAQLVDQPTETRSDLRLAFARILLDANRLTPARAQLEQVLADQPEQSEAALLLGMLALNLGDTETARARLTPLLDSDRKQDAALQLGRLAESESRWEEALAFYASVNRGPAGLDAAIRRAVVMGRLGRTDEARALLEALRHDVPPLSVRLYLAEADILVTAGSLAAARQLYDRALAEHPGHLDLLYGRSLLLEEMGEIAASEADLQQMIEADPQDARALNALGYMLIVHHGALAQARPLIEQAIALAPDDAAVIDSMGWLLFREGDTAGALPYLQRAHDLFPDPEVAAHLGEVLWMLGDREAARTVWDAALERDPQHPLLRETLNRLQP